MYRYITLSLLLIGMSWSIKAQTFGDYKVDAGKVMGTEALQQTVQQLQQKSTPSVDVNDITIKGKVNEVCQAKGCWMTTTLENGTPVTIKFKDYAFFMPLDCAGKSFICHGKLFVKTTSVEELRHLAEDAGKSKKQIKAIKKPKEELRFEADGVELM